MSHIMYFCCLLDKTDQRWLRQRAWNAIGYTFTGWKELMYYIPGCSGKRRLGGKKSEWELVGSFTLRSHVDTLKGNETR